MIVDKSFHRGRDETGEGQAVSGPESLQLCPAGAAETAHHAHGETVIAREGSLEQVAEVPFHQSVHIGLSPVFQDERRQAPEVAGRCRALIDIPDDGSIVHFVKCRKRFHQLLRNQVLDEIREEKPAEGRCAALVANDETPAVDVPDNLSPS